TRIYNVNGLLRYILKGSDPNKAGIFEIRHSKQGKIWGRRAVASTCLGKAARERDRDNGMILEGR
ncbi:hypothetical protein, partial [Ochrobactrum sp. POC9]|uniref:hypothetical protein n=1 Tax=Ochrobactrum sp. POC9 TaxID=2203419 RepID=UPI001AECA72D